MSGRRSRSGGFFLAPEAPQPASPALAAAPRAGDLVGVLAAEPLLPAATATVARGLRRDARTRTAVVATTGAGAPPGPAAPAARAMARRLAGAESTAVAAGALCRVDLPGDPGAACREAWRLVRVAGVPVVVGFAERDDELDALLAAADRLVLATAPDADEALVLLAVAALARLGPPTSHLVLPGGPVGRRLAALGLGGPGRDPEPVAP